MVDGLMVDGLMVGCLDLTLHAYTFPTFTPSDFLPIAIGTHFRLKNGWMVLAIAMIKDNGPAGE